MSEFKKCKKAIFRTQSDADEFIDKINRTSNRKVKPLRSYMCEECLNWHTSSSLDYFDIGLKKAKENLREAQSIIRDKDKEIERIKSEFKSFCLSVSSYQTDSKWLKKRARDIRAKL